MSSVTHLVLVHDLLVGPYTWVPVMQALRGPDLQASTPSLTSPGGLGVPFWQHHCDEVAFQLREIDYGAPVLVGHSSTGPLLPRLGRALPVRPAAYVFVDSDIPRDGASRFDLFGDADAVAAYREAAPLPSHARRRRPADAQARSAEAPSDAVVREWPFGLLADAVCPTPDDSFVQPVFAGRRPTPLGVFEEPLPVPPDWPEAPCGYLHLSPTYAGAAEDARGRGWAVRSLPAGHFAMLQKPEAVAGELLALAGELTSASG